MTVETVKVYKGKENITVNKTDVEMWNEHGYFTSLQQKKAAEGTKLQKKAAEGEDKK